MFLHGIKTFARRAAFSTVVASPMITTGTLSLLPLSPLTQCATNEPAGMAAIQKQLEGAMPIAGGCGVGGVLGFSAGYFLKKTGQAVCFVFGGLFVLQQSLAYLEYVNVNWPKVNKDLTQLFDMNKDGVIDVNDFSAGQNLAVKVLKTNPEYVSGSFTAGLLYGMKRG